ncbi:uncharacterized protein LOC120527075 [Polypterus senegalus]|uniref:Secretory calcium-binding phosphoprotein 7 n=1 Tax=Polypterus senegalus TaxID=55291 RepID=A0A250DVC2_POLSE|nr:uncharacterized protein LOC120527075 [Polypterus senegalus]ATA58041.1 secretory calcium-binding phosphoprotein 7 [Polypterus senegalus]
MKAVALLVCLLGSTFAIPMSQLYYELNPQMMLPQIPEPQGIPQQQIPEFGPGISQPAGTTGRASFEIIIPYGARQQPGSIFPSHGFIKQSIPQPGRRSLEILYPFGYGNTAPIHTSGGGPAPAEQEQD